MFLLQPKTDPSWTGFLRFFPHLTVSVLLISTVVFTLSCVLGFQFGRMKVYSHELLPSIPEIIFYEVTTPFLSIIHGVITLLVSHYHHAWAQPLSSLVASTILLVGWIIQFSFWTTIDLLDQSGLGFAIKWPKVAPGGVQYARFLFALFGLIGYITLTVFSSVADHRRGRELLGDEEKDEK